MTIGNTAGAEVARNAEFTLFADFGALAGKLFCVARVVELAGFFEAGENDLGEEFAVGAAEKLLLHFVNGVSTAHEDAEGIFVEVLLGVEFARPGEHERRVR